MPPSLRARTSRSSRPYRRSSITSTTEPLPALEQLANTDPVSPRPATTSDAPSEPTYAEYKSMEAGYLSSLSPRKRDKVLITQAMFDKIWEVLHQPDACTIETPQFRFWVRKMFRFSRPVWVTDEGINGGKPVVWTSQDAIARDAAGDDDSDSDAEAGAAEAEVEAQDLALERAMGIGSAEHPVSDVVLHENRPVAIMDHRGRSDIDN